MLFSRKLNFIVLILDSFQIYTAFKLIPYNLSTFHITIKAILL